MFCKRLSLRFAVPAFLSKLLYSQLKSLKINRRIRLFKRSSFRILFTREMPHHRTIIKVRKYKCLIKMEHGFSRHQFAKPCHNAKLIVYLFSWIKIYSSKILFTSFHLNNQTESGRRILCSCCFCLILIFSRSLRTATLDTSFRPPFELHNHSYENTYVCFLKVASIT